MPSRTKSRKQTRAKTAGALTSESYRTLCRSLPSYDPFRNSDAFEFDPDRAQQAIEFFRECLTFTTGEWRGQPFALQPWQEAIVATLFGWARKRDGLRRYREVLIYVPRKSGKTEMAAGLALILLCADREPGAQVVCAAADRDQARLVHNAAKTMVMQDAKLSEKLGQYRDSITYAGGAMKVISAEAYSKHGLNAHGIIIDELHAQPDRELVDVLTTSTGARRQPLTIYITTADYDRESICNEKHAYACSVRDGAIDDPTFLPIIYEASRDDDWTDPAVWRKSNPNLGVTVSLDYFERECRKARETPSYENTFKRLHLNMRTQQDVRWLSLDKWDACNGEIDADALAGAVCYGGLDMSSTTDLTAFVLAFPQEGGRVALLPFFWLPEAAAAAHERSDRAAYQTWAARGHIRITGDNVVDYDLVRDDIRGLAERYAIVEIAVDPWNATQIAVQLQSDGANVVFCGQHYRDLSAPTKQIERLILARNLIHGGNPVLRWMAGNVAVESDGPGNIKLSKKKSRSRIDGLIASVMAIGRLMSNSAVGESVYDTQGLELL